MITTSQEYLQYLQIIQDQNFPQLLPADLPKDEPKLEIDLNTRKVSAPEFLSVSTDHNSETLYFIVDRYFDNVDLATTSCIVQYKNANPDPLKNGFLYAPTKYFLTEDQKLIFPWVIEGAATAYSGVVEYSVRFYRITGEYNEDPELSNLEYEYILNTLSAKSKVLTGMDVLEQTENYTYEANTVEDIYQRIFNITNLLSNDYGLYWIDVR